MPSRQEPALGFIGFLFILGLAEMDEQSSSPPTEQDISVYQGETAAEEAALDLWHDRKDATGVFLIYDQEEDTSYILANSDHMAFEDRTNTQIYDTDENYYFFSALEDSALSEVGEDTLERALADNQARFVFIPDSHAHVTLDEMNDSHLHLESAFLTTPFTLDISEEAGQERRLSKYGYVREVEAISQNDAQSLAPPAPEPSG